MDRRDFLKSMILTPAITPYLLGSEGSDSAKKLYIISDEPEIYLPYLLKNLKLNSRTSPRSFSFLGPHPKEEKMAEALEKIGWHKNSSKPTLRINFSTLTRPTFASFTLIDKGRIVDIRKLGLKKTWEKMSKSSSKLLTVASMNLGPSLIKPGERVAVWINGQLIDRFSLNLTREKSYPTRLGSVTLEVKNGLVTVTHSDCRHKVCLSASPITLAGERIICAPNRFLVEIQGKTSLFDTIIG